MQAIRTTQRGAAAGQIITACFGLSLWLALWALSVSPHLHEQLHTDPNNPGHECLLTLLHKGHVLPGQPVLLAPAANYRVMDLPQRSPTEHFSPQDYRLTPSRAPPVFSLAS